MEQNEKQLIEEKLKIEKQFQSGADWFFWIAGLSIINSVILFSGSEWGFIIGLGITRIIDAIGLLLAEEIGVAGKILAFIFTVIAAGIFVLFGVFARKRYKWAFVVGMILYALDGLIFLLLGDLLSVGFHIFVLFCIFGGFKACGKLNGMQRAESLGIQSPTTPDSQSHESF
jgi:hypothetical protein